MADQLLGVLVLRTYKAYNERLPTNTLTLLLSRVFPEQLPWVPGKFSEFNTVIPVFMKHLALNAHTSIQLVKSAISLHNFICQRPNFPEKRLQPVSD